jgi:hypothetical protein
MPDETDKGQTRTEKKSSPPQVLPASGRSITVFPYVLSCILFYTDTKRDEYTSPNAYVQARSDLVRHTFGYYFSVLGDIAHPQHRIPLLQTWNKNCWNCLRPSPIKMMNDNKLSAMFYLQPLIHTASFNFTLNVPP